MSPSPLCKYHVLALFGTGATSILSINLLMNMLTGIGHVTTFRLGLGCILNNGMQNISLYLGHQKFVETVTTVVTIILKSYAYIPYKGLGLWPSDNMATIFTQARLKRHLLIGQDRFHSKERSHGAAWLQFAIWRSWLWTYSNTTSFC